MSNYRGTSLSPTKSCLAASMLLAPLMSTVSQPSLGASRDIIPSVSYSLRSGNLPTFDQYSNIFVKFKIVHEPDDFERSIHIFYSNLMLSQEPLDKEAEDVLYNNLWDLYTR